VKLVDANVLLYAVNEDAAHHEQSRTWLDAALGGAATVGFAWTALLAFVRLSTRPGLFPSPLGVDGALARVGEWLAQPSALVLEPTARHLEVLTELLTPAGIGGNLVADAHLAALAVEHRATIVTFDADFGRFTGIKWEQPARLA
jgi:toxin-antitoxin system PIN domain toxin